MKYSVGHGKTQTQFTGMDLGKVKEILGVNLTSDELASIVDPTLVLSKRKASGSPNPVIVLKACKAGVKLIAKHEATLGAFEHEIAESERLLENAIQKIRKNRDERGKLARVVEVKE